MQLRSPTFRSLRWLQLRSLVLLACLGFWSLAGQAQESDKSIDCKRVDQGGSATTIELLACGSRANVEARSRLATIVKQLRKAMSVEFDRKVLDQTQASWWAWKKNEAKLCALSAGYEPEGSGYEMQRNNCAAYLTNQRVKVLQGYLRDIQSR